MNDDGLDALWIATIPPSWVIERLQLECRLSTVVNDMYLAFFTGTSSLAGFLIAMQSNINQLVAFCPIHHDLVVGSALWRHEVTRQRKTATQIASLRKPLNRSSEALWLADDARAGREIPPWIFSLACIPLTYQWDGKLKFPRPFCPRLFESMATQPQAPEWVMGRLSDQQLGENSRFRPGETNE
jgi:hypothetical protein